uniref:Uncharacterized protein n=1 Tax=Arundo donax TaxID=35708 RepID=A0A0A9BXY3_ARUDO
MCVAVVLVYAF